jgi:hypothetical protein
MPTCGAPAAVASLARASVSAALKGLLAGHHRARTRRQRIQMRPGFGRRVLLGKQPHDLGAMRTRCRLRLPEGTTRGLGIERQGLWLPRAQRA